jgi:hypothetical protein
MPKKDPAVIKQVTVSLPFGIGSASWESDQAERRAAWELYIELVTRIAVHPLATKEGLMREALNSLYTLFGSTREILRKAGPNVGASRESVGGISIAVLNNGLRPVLSKWHPMLQEWEVTKVAGVSASGHEKAWSEEPALRKELNKLREDLQEYANALAEIAGVNH